MSGFCRGLFHGGRYLGWWKALVSERKGALKGTLYKFVEIRIQNALFYYFVRTCNYSGKLNLCCICIGSISLTLIVLPFNSEPEMSVLPLQQKIATSGKCSFPIESFVCETPWKTDESIFTGPHLRNILKAAGVF